MKKNCAIILVIAVFLSSNVKGQITVGKIEYQKEVKQSLISYDGTSDFKYQENGINYNQYIGLQIYFPDVTNIHFLVEHNLYVDLDKPGYFTITGIILKKDFKSDLRTASGNFVDLLIVLKSADGTKEFNYPVCFIENNIYFVLVPFFVNQKKLFDGKKFVIVTKSGSLVDEVTKETLDYDEPLYCGIWTCEVNIIQPLKTDHWLEMNVYYILRNSKGNVVIEKPTQPINEDNYHRFLFVDKLEDNQFYEHGDNTLFMSVDNYNSEIERIKKEKNTVTAKDQTEKQKRLKNLEIKYGAIDAHLISQGKVKLGMNSEMCSIAWDGLYGIISRMQDSAGTFEVWKHALYGTRLYFKNGKLYKIVD
jgi:hypothetical protein